MKRSSKKLVLAALPAFLTMLGGVHAQGRERPPVDAFHAARAVSLAATPLVGAHAASVDAKRGVPVFVWGDRAHVPAALGFADAAREHLAMQAPAFGVADEALAHVEIARVHDLGRGGVVVVLRQRVAGVPLFHHEVKMLLDRERRMVAMTGALHAAAVPSAKLAPFSLSRAQATAVALSDLHGVPFTAADLQGGAPGHEGVVRFSMPETLGVRLRSPLRARPVWFALPDALVPAFYVEVDTRASDGDHAYGYVVSAVGGEVLYRTNLTHAATFKYRVWAETGGDLRPTDGPLGDFSPHPTGLADGSYPVAVPPPLIEMEAFNATKDPWLADGAAETKGNNVDAYTDDDSPDGFSKNDVRAKVTAPGVFDRVYDLGKDPTDSDEQRMASVTQIFYTNNWLHDWWYASGFDEVGGNAQESNYGRGGVEGDPLLAEAQNGTPQQRDNANMSAFEEGASPRMQMFVWEPDSAGGAFTPMGGAKQAAGTAGFGPPAFTTTGTVVRADDGAAPTDDVCTAIQNDVKGKIVLVQRGTCPFVAKAQAVEAAGGLAMVLYDNQTSAKPPSMGGSMGVTIQIPVLSITKASGEALVAALAGGPVTATMEKSASPDRDGTIDNTVVAHEWGHYLHLRNVKCGSAQCFAESEGWGDMSALMLVVREGDDLEKGTFALSQYAARGITEDAGYFGIRRYPYSTDLTKNPLTFKHITSGVKLPDGVPVSKSAQNDNAEVHAAGEVWATMLLEAYASLVARSKPPVSAYTFEEARRRLADYIVQGLQLAPVDPTYTEQRDAILAAAAARDPEDVKVLSAAFAKRGAGTCAVSPPRDSVDFSGLSESFAVEASVNVLSITVDDSVDSCDKDGNLDAGETGLVQITVRNVGTSSVTGAKATLTTKTEGATFPDGASVDLPELAPFASATVKTRVKYAPTKKGKAHLDLAVGVQNVAVCTETSALVAAPFVDVDEVSVGSKVDDVEASTSNFGPTGAFAKRVWSRIEASPGNHVWSGIDYGSPSDTRLESPTFLVGEAEPFVLSWKHRHQFETSMDIFWDGAVVEVTTDGGATWDDVSTLGDVAYNGTIGDPNKQAKNALRGRKGFVDKNTSYPAFDTITVDMGKALAGKKVAFRFRIGTDDAAGGLGWQLDDITVAGVVEGPFSALSPDADKCAKPTGSAGAAGKGGAAGSATTAELVPAEPGGGCACEAPSSRGSGLALLVALAALAARRSPRKRGSA